MSARETRVERDGALEQMRGGCIVDAIEAIDVLQGQMIGGPSIEIFRRGETRQRGFVHWDTDFKRGENSRPDLIADRVYVVDLPRKSVGPYDAIVVGVDEIHGDDEAPVGDLDRAP